MAEEIQPHEVLFVGKGRSVPAWYRCALPALALGCDWAGLINHPPGVGLVTGNVQSVPDWEKYKVVIGQQWAGEYWKEHVLELQSRGIKVIYELDDNIRGVREMPDHDRRFDYSREYVNEHIDVMYECDGMICSTPKLREDYGDICEKSWVCRNGLDLGRYSVTKPQRDEVHIGWFGGSGHRIAFSRWLEPLEQVMEEHPETRFVNIGDPVAQLLSPEFRERSLYIPWSNLETFPAAMTNIDISLAPAGDKGIFRGKSDLRWLEAAALAIPTIANPTVYPDIIHGVTGWHAPDPQAVYEGLSVLVESDMQRIMMGKAAREHLRHDRTIESTCMDWVRPIEEVTD